MLLHQYKFTAGKLRSLLQALLWSRGNKWRSLVYLMRKEAFNWCILEQLASDPNENSSSPCWDLFFPVYLLRGLTCFDSCSRSAVRTILQLRLPAHCPGTWIETLEDPQISNTKGDSEALTSNRTQNINGRRLAAYRLISIVSQMLERTRTSQHLRESRE